jgi:hypothetical protein
MKRAFAALSFIMIVGSASAWAQDATTTPAQTQATSPTPPSDTSSPLTPTNPSTSSPLTPNPINPVTGQTQQPTAASVQSSSEVPSSFVQAPVETIRLDASAPSNLSLEIDPSSSQATLLNPDVTQLTPIALGVSLNTVQQTTGPVFSTPVPLSTSRNGSSSFYPARLSALGSTQSFSTGTVGSRQIPTSTLGSSASNLGPPIGSAAVMSSSAVESMTTSPTSSRSSTFMRAPASSSMIMSPVASTSAGTSSIGPRGLRTSFRGSSTSHRLMSSSHH